MKDISKHLFHFIQNHFAEPLNDIDTSLSKKSQAFLRSIYERILLANAFWTKASQNIQEGQIKQIVDKGNDNQQGPYYSFIPAEIKVLLANSTKYEKLYKFEINGRKYTIKMTYPIQEGSSWTISKIKRTYANALYKIYLWLFVVGKSADSKCSKEMHVNIYFTDHLKILAKNKMEPLDEIHANTAFTTSCAPSTEITLFREEEWFKVFIHETFHNLGLDFSQMSKKDIQMCDRQIWSIFPIKTEVRLFETYCETWAEIIHLMFLAFFGTKNKSDWMLILHKIEGYMRYEAIWSAFQCAKILDHYQLTYIQFTDVTCPRAKLARDNQYNEKTYILSYFVIKSIFMVQANEFLDWSICHNGQTLEFKKTSANMMAYCGLVSRLYQTPQFIDCLAPLEQWFHNQSKMQRNKEFEVILDTMRMTLFEL